jgi:DNA polymerase III subunit alpha, Gram-positive type
MSSSKNSVFNKESLLKKWSHKKLTELSVHTKFSALDGINSPADYLNVFKDRDKDYKCFAVTDHSSVQSFPEFWEASENNKDLKIVYGCEFEMLEKNFPNFLVVGSKNKKIFEKKIDEITYCVFDLETTGLFSTYDEIIEFGYVIFKDKEIISEKSFLIKPNRHVSDFIYKFTNIDREELNNAPSLKDVLFEIRKDWEENQFDVLVSHNAIKFDFPFLNKAWIEIFGKKINYSIIDTLPLSRLAFPGKKSYSLEKLSSGKDKIKQSHRALDDSLLLKDLFDKIIKISKEKEFTSWRDFESEVKEKFYYRGIGTKIVALAKNKKGLSDLYKLVKISHVDNFFKTSFLFRSDIKRYRKNLLIGSSGDFDGEIMSLFSAFNLGENVEEKIKFYDYIEVRGVDSFTHLIANEKISKSDLESILFSVISSSKRIGVKVVSVNNVHYSDKNQKKIKEIVIANEGINGSRHYFYDFAMEGLKRDGFESLPAQHLRTKREIIENWSFLQDENVINEIVFENPELLTSEIDEVKIFDTHIGYPRSIQKEKDLFNCCLEVMHEMFGKKIPLFVLKRFNKEWNIIKENYLPIYWISWKVVAKAHEDGSIVGSRGSVGCSLIAYLLKITDINPLNLYSLCRNCKFYKEGINDSKESDLSCYDFDKEERCPYCKKGTLKFEGHSLPFETFVGWKGERTPDIDLNFSGEYQKFAHDYIRELLGKDYVYRIGTVNKLSQQTAENFWNGHQKLRKTINPRFNLMSWSNKFTKNKNSYDNSIKAKELILNQLKGIKRTTGQHPGGLLIVPPGIKIIDFTPLNYPADDDESEWLTTHFEYSFLSKIFFKLDILGHDEPTILQKFFSATGKDPLNDNDVSFNDKKIMDIFTNCDTLGIPEFGTDLVKKSLLKPIRPTKFSQLVQISGFSHGTDVWMQNQQQVYRSKKLPLNKLLACREDILSLLNSKGVDKENAFNATEFIRKGKWDKLDENVKEVIKEKLKGEEGEIYFSILEKIKYIFPKPHAIAYTMTAWRTAYYKVYFPEVFYSVLLTYHASIYDVWLMTCDTKKSIPFHLIKILEKLDSLKTSKKDFISIAKVLIKLGKEEDSIRTFANNVFGYNENYYEIFNLKKGFNDKDLKDSFDRIVTEKHELLNGSNSLRNIEKCKKDIDILINARDVILDEEKRSIYDKELKINEIVKKNFAQQEINDWKLTMKEKNLLFTLRIIVEIKKKGFDFSLGLDFNYSSLNNFDFVNGKMLIPFTAINGIGEKVAEKIINYRTEYGKIKDWKEDLKKIINKKNFEQILNLENNGLLFQ